MHLVFLPGKVDEYAESEYGGRGHSDALPAAARVRSPSYSADASRIAAAQTLLDGGAVDLPRHLVGGSPPAQPAQGGGGVHGGGAGAAAAAVGGVWRAAAAADVVVAPVESVSVMDHVQVHAVQPLHG